ncbi:MAG TPA: DUF4881 domain-containing protein [Syntrophobacteraceae bacterium]|nr:DUF4881 domain-containing protein [Syntrophobacteraceae bacterium]
MARHHKLIFSVLLVLPLIFAAACNYGKVDQGRVVKFDKAKGTVCIIRDCGSDSRNPDYRLPTVVYTMPEDPAEVGPEPKSGLRIKLDSKNNQITFCNIEAGKLETISYTLIDQKEGVAEDDPLVFDASRRKVKKFPSVDREKKTITVYSSRQKVLTTFSLPEEYFRLPEYTWDAGDEVRIYYKEEGKALRFMNVTKTDIFKK